MTEEMTREQKAADEFLTDVVKRGEKGLPDNYNLAVGIIDGSTGDVGMEWNTTPMELLQICTQLMEQATEAMAQIAQAGNQYPEKAVSVFIAATGEKGIDAIDLVDGKPPAVVFRPLSIDTGTAILRSGGAGPPPSRAYNFKGTVKGLHYYKEKA